jgi:hypothetical protein
MEISGQLISFSYAESKELCRKIQSAFADWEKKAPSLIMEVHDSIANKINDRVEIFKAPIMNQMFSGPQHQSELVNKNEIENPKT